MFQQALAAILVLALLMAALWFLRSRGFATYGRLARGKSLGHLETIARLPLAPQHSVHLIRVSDHAILLGVSPSGCTLLESIPWRVDQAGSRTCDQGCAKAYPGVAQ
jgi:flagellar biosynthetic protein FliO